MEKDKGILYIVSTPIGNLEDISHRALQVLGAADALACEDTRHTRKLFTHFELPSPKIFFSYHDHNESSAGRKILKLLDENKRVALCSDAGTPGISDPGYRIISEAVKQGYHVDVIPGPSAVISALLASGLSTSSFTFKGFPPRKKGPMGRFLEMDKGLPHTLIFYESPHRVAKFLESALEILGNRMASVCIDLTKMYEEIHNDHLQALVETFKKKKVKGEISIVIAGNNPKFSKSETEADGKKRNKYGKRDKWGKREDEDVSEDPEVSEDCEVSEDPEVSEDCEVSEDHEASEDREALEDRALPGGRDVVKDGDDGGHDE